MGAEMGLISGRPPVQCGSLPLTLCHSNTSNCHDTTMQCVNCTAKGSFGSNTTRIANTVKCHSLLTDHYDFNVLRFPIVRNVSIFDG